MRRALPTLLVLVPVIAAAQQRPAPPTRGFEPTAVLSLSKRSFGGRQEAHGTATAKYEAPLGFDLTIQVPFSRRGGFELGTTYIADTRQRTDEGTDSRISAVSLKHTTVRGALAFRFRPFVPFYLLAGGGVARATRFAVTGVRGAATEPEVNFGFGIDPRSHERVGVRIRYLGSIVFPDAPHLPGIGARGPTYDWSLQAGVRVPLVRHAARRTP